MFLKKLVPPRVRRELRDISESFRRVVPGKHLGWTRHNLRPTQVYPHGTNFDVVLRLGIQEKTGGFRIRKDTRISSIGSCFAEEFASFMINGCYNYLRTGDDVLNASCDRAGFIPQQT